MLGLFILLMYKIRLTRPREFTNDTQSFLVLPVILHVLPVRLLVVRGLHRLADTAATATTHPISALHSGNGRFGGTNGAAMSLRQDDGFAKSFHKRLDDLCGNLRQMLRREKERIHSPMGEFGWWLFQTLPRIDLLLSLFHEKHAR